MEPLIIILYVFLFSYFGAIVIATLIYLKRAYQRFQKINHEDIINTVLIIILFLITIGILLGIITELVLDMDFTEDIAANSTVFYLMIVVFGIPLICSVIVVITNIIQYARRSPKLLRYGSEMALKPEKKKYKSRIDVSRKFFHFLTFAIAAIYVLFMRAFADNYSHNEFWGEFDGSEVVVRLGTDLPFPVVGGIIVCIFYGTIVVMLTIETTRLSHHVHFPFHQSIQRTLRQEELNTFATYTHMGVGFFFLSIFVPPNAFLASFSLFAIGDMMASFIGIRFGKHRYSWCDKSVEGTLAGFLSSFLISALFVGWSWGFALGVLFVILDLITPSILKASDNLLIPVCSVILFFILSQLQILAAFPIFHYLFMI